MWHTGKLHKDTCARLKHFAQNCFWWHDILTWHRFQNMPWEGLQCKALVFSPDLQEALACLIHKDFNQLPSVAMKQSQFKFHRIPQAAMRQCLWLCLWLRLWLCLWLCVSLDMSHVDCLWCHALAMQNRIMGMKSETECKVQASWIDG